MPGLIGRLAFKYENTIVKYSKRNLKFIAIENTWNKIVFVSSLCIMIPQLWYHDIRTLGIDTIHGYTRLIHVHIKFDLLYH